jgi:hypothetical protein
MATARTISALVLGAFLSTTVVGAAGAGTFTSAGADAFSQLSAPVILVANGCGAGWYRGPGGACHPYGRGPYPAGYYGPRRYVQANGCPVGYWRGPWGHCRNTPYHGPLPGGGWK